MATNPFASLDSRRACRAASGFALRALPGTLAHGRLLHLEGLFKTLNESLYPERGRGSKNQFACKLSRRKPGYNQLWIPAFAGMTGFLSSLRSLRNPSVFAGEGEWLSNSQHLAKPRPPSPNLSRKGRGIRSRPFLWFRVIGTDSHRDGGDRPPS